MASGPDGGPSGVLFCPGVLGVGVGVARGVVLGAFLTLQFLCVAWTVFDALHFFDTGFAGVPPSDARVLP